MGFTKSSYANMITLLQNRGFIHSRDCNTDDVRKIVFDYWPLGTLLRQNILKQWWNCMLQSHSNVYPIETCSLSSVHHDCPTNPTLNILESQSNQSRALVTRETLQEDCLRSYQHIFKLTNKHLPFSIATTGVCLSNQPENSSPQRNCLLGGSTRSELLLHNYVHPSSSSRVQDFWIQHRLSWWKKFSRNPSKFSVRSESTFKEESNTSSCNGSTADNQNELSIDYEFPWGSESVEVIRNTKDNYFKSFCSRDLEKYKAKSVGSKSSLPHCIECISSIELAASAWLCDSFRERKSVLTTEKSTKRKKMVLQLHHQIAPYQVAICRVSTSSSESYKHEIHHICTHLVIQLRQKGISVFDASEHGSTLAAHFNRNDQFGIPYTVILNEDTLQEGTVSIRKRDTEVQMISHIASVPMQMEDNLKAQLTEYHGQELRIENR